MLCICHTPPFQPWTPPNETVSIWYHAVEFCRLSVQGSRNHQGNDLGYSQTHHSEERLRGISLCQIARHAIRTYSQDAGHRTVHVKRTLLGRGSRVFKLTPEANLSLSMYSMCHAVLKNSREKMDIWNYPKGLYIFNKLNVFPEVYMNARASVGVGVKTICFFCDDWTYSSFWMFAET